MSADTASVTTATPTAIVIVAMDDEAAPFLDMADSVTEIVAGAAFTARSLLFGQRSIALIVAGIGMVNGAHAATQAIVRWGAGVPVISAGSAGGLGADIRVGEVILSSTLVNLDADVRAFGYALGQVPGMPAEYEASSELRGAALADSSTFVVRSGVIGSGDRFVTTDVAHQIRQDFPAISAVDMESAAIAQIAFRHDVPFVSVRAISDLCAPDGDEFLTHIDDAARNSAAVVVAALARL